MRVLLTEDFHPILKERLQALNLQIDEDIQIDYQGVCKIIQDYEILIVNSKIVIDKNLLAKAQKLKIVGRIGSGMDIFDLPECDRHHVKTLTSPEGNANAVAEHIIGFILSAFHNLQKSQSDLLRGEWLREENRGTELCGKTLSIIGFGHNGCRLAELLQGFDMEILAYDIVEIPTNIKNVKMATLEEIFQKTDILSIHLPLTVQTDNFVNAAFISKFKKNIYFVNASRGKICPVSNLLPQIASGKIIQAMLDVYDNEPIELNEQMRTHIANHKLFLSPHIAGWTIESKFKLANILAEKIEMAISHL